MSYARVIFMHAFIIVFSGNKSVDELGWFRYPCLLYVDFCNVVPDDWTSYS